MIRSFKYVFFFKFKHNDVMIPLSFSNKASSSLARDDLWNYALKVKFKLWIYEIVIKINEWCLQRLSMYEEFISQI